MNQHGEPSTEPDAHQLHIMVVNDDEAVLTLFEEILHEEGYRVTLDTFLRPTSQILAEIGVEVPDLVVLDFLVGGEAKGWQLLQAMKMQRTTAAIPIVVCTASVNQVNELEAHLRELGIEIVIKPFDIDHLTGAISRAIARHA